MWSDYHSHQHICRPSSSSRKSKSHSKQCCCSPPCFCLVTAKSLEGLGLQDNGWAVVTSEKAQTVLTWLPKEAKFSKAVARTIWTLSSSPPLLLRAMLRTGDLKPCTTQSAFIQTTSPANSTSTSLRRILVKPCNVTVFYLCDKFTLEISECVCPWYLDF